MIFIFVYPVGVPAFFGMLLYLNRHMLGIHATGGQDPNAWWYGDRDTLHFLVDGYRPATFWFEQVDFLRKLMMAGGVIFLDRGSANQFFMAIFASMIFLVVDSFLRPYVDFRCNALKVLTSLSMLVTLLCGFASKLDPLHEVVSDDTLGYILIVSNFIIVLLILSLEIFRRLVSIVRGVRSGIAYVEGTKTICALTGVASYEGEFRQSAEDKAVNATVKAYPLHIYPDARLVHSKIQALGNTALLCPVYGCETEGGVLFMATTISTTTLSEHIEQFHTCPISAKDFCSTVTNATLQLHTACKSS
jgi:hypothetical protein